LDRNFNTVVLNTSGFFMRTLTLLERRMRKKIRIIISTNDSKELQ